MDQGQRRVLLACFLLGALLLISPPAVVAEGREKDNLGGAHSPTAEQQQARWLQGQHLPPRESIAATGPPYWLPVASMHMRRSDLAAALGPDGRVYALGGVNGDGDAQASVEAYTPATNRWALVASMLISRSQFAAVTAPDGRLYAVNGGWRGRAMRAIRRGETRVAWRPTRRRLTAGRQWPAPRWTCPAGRRRQDMMGASISLISARPWPTPGRHAVGFKWPASPIYGSLWRW